jgi:formylglycine-generating enzyme required for sulfatase activity
MIPALRRTLLAGLLVATTVAAGAQPARPARSVAIPAGSYQPLYAPPASRQAVAAFRLDRDPVTRAEYAAFLRRRAGAGCGTRDAGRGPACPPPHRSSGDEARRPATGMTWHEANAFCAERGARLPTLAEWEYVAAASETRRNASDDAAFRQRLLEMYAARARLRPAVDQASTNVYGVRGMHDLVWEWVADAGAHSHEHDHSGGHDAWCASASIGASDPTNYPAFLRFAVRSRLRPDDSLQTLGFRCAF